jgi:hypothetical protein
MDQRGAPRFQVNSPAKVTRLDDPERELNCRLIDISATGMKLVADESLPADEIISVEVEHHLVLADVRYSLPWGSKFAIGVEKVHTLQKLTLSKETTRIQKIHTLIDDFRLPLHSGRAGAAPGRSVERALAQIQQRFQSYFEERASGAPGPVAPPLETEQAAPALEASLHDDVLKSGPTPGSTDPLIDAPITTVVANSDNLPQEPPPDLARRNETIRHLLESLEKTRPRV